MTGASEDLLQAVYGLRKAAEEQFTGNDYYRVANEIDVLIELLGWGDGPVPVGQGASYGFATMLGEVRKLARAHTSGSQYNVIVHKLDQLGSYAAPASNVPMPATPVSEKPAAAPEPAATPAPEAAPVEVPASVPAPTPSAANPAFEDLAAASKARVEEVAASLGIATAHHVAPAHNEAEAAPAAGGASEELLQALYGLRKAAEAQFTGNAYYQVANEIDGLIELLGWGDGRAPAGQDAVHGFATMLDEVRKTAEAGTSRNQYFAIVCKLDQLASYVTPAPVSEKPAAVVAPADHAAEVAETRSSEPGATAELAPVAVEAAAEAAALALPEDHAHHTAGGDGAKCPFHALFADTAEALAAEPAPAHEEPAPASEAAPEQPEAEVALVVIEAIAVAETAPASEAAPAQPEAEAAAVVIEAVAVDVPAQASEAAPEQPEAEVAVVVIEAIAVDEPVPAPEAAPEQPEAEAPAVVIEAIAVDEPAPAPEAAPEQPEAEVATVAFEAPSQAEAAEAPSERRLESPSSGAVSHSLEFPEPAAISGQTAPELGAAEASPDLGSPAAQGEAIAAEEQGVEEIVIVEEIAVVEAPTAEIAQEPAVAAAPAPEAAAPAAGQKIEANEPAGTGRKEPKTLFTFLFGRAFGRKD